MYFSSIVPKVHLLVFIVCSVAKGEAAGADPGGTHQPGG